MNGDVMSKSITANEICSIKIAQWECRDSETDKTRPDKNAILPLQAIF